MNTKEEKTSGEPATVVAGRGKPTLYFINTLIFIYSTSLTSLFYSYETNLLRPPPLLCISDSSTNETGLHLAVGSMRVGERARAWVKSEYGYGPRGNFSFPTIPPNADLIYDIELLDFEPPTDGKSQSDMTFEERLEAAERRRADGNEAYKAGRYEEALGRYSVALSFVDEDLMIQLQGFHYDKAVAARTPALLNSAACHLKLENYNGCIGAASQVLAEDPKNAKALYRRGCARHALGQTDAALKDLQAGWQLAPGDAGLGKELAAVKKSMQEERRAQANMFKGLLDKASKDGGLYSDEEEDYVRASGIDGTSVREGGNSEKGWFMGLLQSWCPIFFGPANKSHTQ